MGSWGCLDRTPPAFWPALNSSLASSWALGKTWALIRSTNCSRPPSLVRVSKPRSLAMRKASPRRPSTILLTRTLRSRPASSPLGLGLADAAAPSSWRPGRGWGEIPASASESGPTGSELLPVGEDSTSFLESNSFIRKRVRNSQSW